MLTSFRKLMEGPGKYVFLALIVAAFGVVGVPAISNFGQADVVKVGDRGFDVQDVEDEFSSRYQQAQSERETAFTREEAIQQGLLDDTVNFLTLKGLVLEDADRLGLTVTDKMIQDALRSVPAFQNEESGEFDFALFQRYLQFTGESVTEFREGIRFDLLRQQVASAVTGGGLPSAPGPYGRFLVLRQSEERDVTIATLSAADIAEPSDEELTAYYEEHPEQYQRPEYRTFTLVSLSPDAIKERVTIDEDDVRQLFEAREAILGTPETRSFVQARFSNAEAAERALAAVEGGTSFREAAEAEGATIVAFEDDTEGAVADEQVGEAIFAAEETGVIGPIAGLFGTFAVEITNITPATEVTFEDVRPELEDELFNEVYTEELFNLTDEIQAEGDAGASLTEAASQVGLTPRTVGPVSPSGTTPEGDEVEIDPRLVAEAFRFGESGFFEEVDLGAEGISFVQITDVSPDVTIPYAEVADDVKADYLADSRVSALEGMAASMRLDMADGMTFEDAAAKHGATASTRTIAATSGPGDLPPTLVEDLFTQPVGRVLSALNPTGDSILVARTETVRFGPNAQAALIENTVRQQLGRELYGELYTVYVEAIRDEVGVRTNPALLEQRFGTAP